MKKLISHALSLLLASSLPVSARASATDAAQSPPPAESVAPVSPSPQMPEPPGEKPSGSETAAPPESGVESPPAAGDETGPAPGDTDSAGDEAETPPESGGLPKETAGDDSGHEPESPPEEAENTASIFDLMGESSLSMEIDMTAYYLSEMGKAAVSGDQAAGQEAERNRNALIDLNGGMEEKISFDDLYLLSKLICAEAGSDWLSDDFRLCVGEVVLNRVASPEFPDTIYEVVYQKGQYASAATAAFYSLVPSQACVDVALRLLQGERMMAPSVVFQSDHEQGEIFSIYKDRRLGTTFFCVSPNQDLYPVPEA